MIYYLQHYVFVKLLRFLSDDQQAVASDWLHALNCRIFCICIRIFFVCLFIDDNLQSHILGEKLHRKQIEKLLPAETFGPVGCTRSLNTWDTDGTSSHLQDKQQSLSRRTHGHWSFLQDRKCLAAKWGSFGQSESSTLCGYCAGVLVYWCTGVQ